MKKNKSLLFGAAGFAVILAIFLLYTIPYGKVVNNFENEFEQLKTLSATTSGSIRNTKDIQEFNKSLEQLLLLPAQVRTANEKLNLLIKEENFIKKLWRKVKVSQEDISLLENEINSTYSEIPHLTAQLISFDAKGCKDNMTRTSDINSFFEIISTTQKNYENLFTRLTNFSNSNDFSQKLAYDEIVNNLQPINDMCNHSLYCLTNLRNEKYSNFKSSLLNIQTVKAASDLTSGYIEWLKTCRNSADISAVLGADPNQYQKMVKVINNDLAEMRNWSILYGEVIDSEKRANDILVNALNIIDESNNRLNQMEKFASSGEILVVYNSWQDASDEVNRSAMALQFNGGSEEKRIVWNNLISKPMLKINAVRDEVNAHKNYVADQYSDAIQEESTMLGSAQRVVSRGLNRAKNWISGRVEEASNSRIVKELSLGVKALIFGTKALYELQNPNTDPLAWAFSMEDDVNELMEDSEEIMEMDGPSITGKNTFIEGFIDAAYSESFH